MCVCMMEESSDYVCVHDGGEFRLCVCAWWRRVQTVCA